MAEAVVEGVGESREEVVGAAAPRLRLGGAVVDDESALCCYQTNTACKTENESKTKRQPQTKQKRMVLHTKACSGGVSGATAGERPGLGAGLMAGESGGEGPTLGGRGKRGEGRWCR